MKAPKPGFEAVKPFRFTLPPPVPVNFERGEKKSGEVGQCPGYRTSAAAAEKGCVCVAALSASIIISSGRFRPQLSCLDEKMAGERKESGTWSRQVGVA